MASAFMGQRRREQTTILAGLRWTQGLMVRSSGVSGFAAGSTANYVTRRFKSPREGSWDLVSKVISTS